MKLFFHLLVLIVYLLQVRFESGYFVGLSVVKPSISALPSRYVSLYSHVECYLRLFGCLPASRGVQVGLVLVCAVCLLAGVLLEICLHLVPAMSPYLIVLGLPSPPQSSLFLPFCVFLPVRVMSCCPVN